jgi:hypothetical protein
VTIKSSRWRASVAGDRCCWSGRVTCPMSGVGVRAGAHCFSTSARRTCDCRDRRDRRWSLSVKPLDGVSGCVASMIGLTAIDTAGDEAKPAREWRRDADSVTRCAPHQGPGWSHLLPVTGPRGIDAASRVELVSEGSDLNVSVSTVNGVGISGVNSRPSRSGAQSTSTRRRASARSAWYR